MQTSARYEFEAINQVWIWTLLMDFFGHENQGPFETMILCMANNKEQIVTAEMNMDLLDMIAESHFPKQTINN